MEELFKAILPNPLHALIALMLLSIFSMILGYKTSDSCHPNHILSDEGIGDIYSCCMICFGGGVFIISMVALIVEFF